VKDKKSAAPAQLADAAKIEIISETAKKKGGNLSLMVT
jgi:hypothetical protein